MKKNQLNRAALNVLLLGVAALAYLSFSTSKDDFEIPSHAERNVSLATAVKPLDNQAVAPTERAISVEQVHPVDCSHCLQENTPKLIKTSAPALETKPKLDPIFKDIAKAQGRSVPISTFDFLKGSKVGQIVEFSLVGHAFKGRVNAVEEFKAAGSYAVTFDHDLGNLIFTRDRNGREKVQIFFKDDVRVLYAEDFKAEGQDEVLIFRETRYEDLYCVKADPTGKIDNDYEPIQVPAEGFEIVALASNPGSDHVFYLDFDGEEVVSPAWNGGNLISAPPHPRADDPAFIEIIWRRVVEDYAPFNINVTTERADYDAADPDKRLIMVMTPFKTWLPFDTTGLYGIAPGIGVYGTPSPVAWTFVSAEYDTALTVSHEAGHVLGLTHDGNNVDEYYEGHNTPAYPQGWGAIMGAPEFDGFYDEVYQWSRGEYTAANNPQDDIAILGGPANGFGFVPDDHGDAIGAPNVGSLSIVAPNTLSATGLIGTQGDVDYFRFSAVEGDIQVIVSPLDVNSPYTDQGSTTSGANLGAYVELIDEVGNVVAVGQEFGANRLSSVVQTFVPDGIYYLAVDGTGRGNDGTDGFTDYASLGVYTVNAQVALPPLSVFGGPKQEQSILNNDTNTDVFNSTDFGFTTPSAAAIENVFRLANSSTSTSITNLSISLTSGTDFTITQSASGNLLPGEGLFFAISYDPSTVGAHTDKVTITYDAEGPQVFEFAISGIATISATEDNYEDNDSSPNAFDLSDVEDVFLSDYLGPAFFLSDPFDYYTFTVEPNDNLIEVTTIYDASLGNVQFELVNFNGDTLVTTTAGFSQLRFTVPDTYVGAQRKFYIRVTTTDNNTVRNEYDLEWTAIELVAGDDDLYEENDSAGQAFDLTGAVGSRLSDILGLGISKDEDWYKITIPVDPFARMLYVAALFEHSQGDINVQVYDEEFNVKFSETENDKEVVTYFEEVVLEDLIGAGNFTPASNTTVMGLEPQTFYIRIYGDFAGNSYDLIVETLSDDKYEVINDVGDENDTLENAFDLGQSIVGTWLSAIDGVGTSALYAPAATADNFVNFTDEDWYAFQIDGADIVEQLVLEYSSFEEEGLFSLTSTAFEIRDTAGNLLVSTDDVSAIGNGTLTVNNPGTNSFLIRVDASNELYALSGYDFRVTYTTEPPFVEDPIEDQYEENDNFQELFDISDNEGRYLSSIAGYGTLLDPDWYQIAIPDNAASLTASLVFVDADGNMDLTLSKKDGPVHFVSNAGGNIETITWEDPIPGAYALTVTGDRRGNFYNLLWDLTLSEDNYEENDTLLAAFDITGHERRLLNKLDDYGIQKDDDWFKISARADTVELRAEVTFAHDDGDIDLALYNSNGALIRRSISTTDDESLVYSNPAEGDYYLRVYFDNAGNEYDLTWSALSQAEIDAIPAGDDAYEENDQIESAVQIAEAQPRLSSFLGLGIQKDDDWYSIEVPSGNVGLRVECLFTDAEGDIDFEIYDPLGFPVFIRDSATDNELLVVNGQVPAGTYNIRVYGPELGNEYDLYWVAFRDDGFEENDVPIDDPNIEGFNGAYDISGLTGAPLSNVDVPTLGDEDWYVVNVATLDPFIEVTLDYVDENGAIDFQILDASLSVITTANSTNDSETVYVEVTPGVHYIRVYGDNAYNPYDLLVNVFGDDIYEENDVSGDAPDITDTPLLNAAQFDDDWFKFEITGVNSFLTVGVSFLNSNGNIDLELYKSTDLTTPFATSATAGDSEVIRVSGLPGEYYIRVFGDNTNQAYQLLWTVAPDDIYEENDVLADAENITGQQGIPVDAVQFDEDWFQISVPPGNIRLLVDLEYVHADGNMTLSLYDSAGEELALEDTDADDERLSQGIFPFGTSPETYYIKVDGAGLGNDYTLTWNVSKEDNFEGENGNNTFGDASEDLLESEGVRISQTIGYGGALNDDWYKVQINDGDEGIVIELCFVHATDNDIDIELYNSSQGALKRSIGVSDVERIHYTGSPGTYYLRVFGSSGQNPYDLIWNSYGEDNLELGVEGNPQITAQTPDNDAPDTPRRLLETRLNGNFYPGGSDPDMEYYLLEDLTQLDEDWYSVVVEDGEDYFIVDVKFVHEQGDIDVAVYERDTGLLVEQAETTTDNEQILLRDLVPGDYLICVYGYDIKNPKEEPGWAPGSFDPFTDDYSTIEENAAPGGFDYYDLAEESARGLANTYSLQWISSVEDEYDVETPAGGDIEVNDSLVTAAEPVLLNQFGIPDEDNIIDDNVRIITLPNEAGVPQNIEYRSVFTYGNLAQFDDDWFKFTVDTGGVHNFLASISFNELHGDLNMRVYNASGDILGFSQGTSSFEFVEITDSGAATYYIQVVGNNLGVPYTLQVQGFFDDLYEENDILADADENADITDLEGVILTDVFVGRDVDIYRVVIPDNQVHLFVEVFTQTDATYTVDVLDSTGNLLAAGYEQSGGSDNIGSIASGVISPEGGTYYFRVTGANAGFAYGLFWTYDNLDEYEAYTSGLNNDTPGDATELSRLRLEPVYDPDAPGPLDPIQEFAFDYGLLGGLTLGAPSFDPFGHAIQESDDWYAVQIPSWLLATARQGNNNIQVIKRRYSVRLSAEVEFTHTEGDINLEIYDDTDLVTPLARSETTSDIESLVAAIDPTDEGRVYYIRVYGDDNENDYSLKWDFTTNDAYEELEDNDPDVPATLENDTNNLVELAYDLTAVDGVSTEGIWLHEIEYLQDVNGDGEIDGDDGGFTSRTGYGQQTNTDDWYAVVVSNGATEIEVDLRFYSDNDQGYIYGADEVDLDFEVYFLAGNDGDPNTTDLRYPVLIGRSTGDTDNTLFPDDGRNSEQLDVDLTTEIQEAATFEVDEPGIYLIRVYYDNRSHPYTLYWDDIGDPNNDGDADIIDDYLNGDWDFIIPGDLPAAVLLNPDANADGDIFPNWAEFALALDETVADYAIVGQSIVEIDGKEYFQFEFIRRKEAVVRGYEFIVEESPNLNFDGTQAVHLHNESIDSELERVFYRCSKPMDEVGKCFFRLVVNEPTNTK